MKGRRQLFWSNGLKAQVGVDDVSDEVLADESQEAAEILGRMTTEDWGVVRETMREQSCWILLKKVLSEAVLKRLGGLSCSCLRPCGYRVSRTQTVGLHKCALWGYQGRRP